jgi:hypothetical protein
MFALREQPHANALTHFSYHLRRNLHAMLSETELEFEFKCVTNAKRLFNVHKQPAGADIPDYAFHRSVRGMDFDVCAIWNSYSTTALVNTTTARRGHVIGSAAQSGVITEVMHGFIDIDS